MRLILASTIKKKKKKDYQEHRLSGIDDIFDRGNRASARRIDAPDMQIGNKMSFQGDVIPQLSLSSMMWNGLIIRADIRLKTRLRRNFEISCRVSEWLFFTRYKILTTLAESWQHCSNYIRITRFNASSVIIRGALINDSCDSKQVNVGSRIFVHPREKGFQGD